MTANGVRNFHKPENAEPGFLLCAETSPIHAACGAAIFFGRCGRCGDAPSEARHLHRWSRTYLPGGGGELRTLYVAT
ncbi:hypothetical protein FM113_02130 [Leucobacter sp. 7(1)]|nr:hypothetical protein FM113_02130 [Leucobacter sp. 7(1)]